MNKSSFLITTILVLLFSTFSSCKYDDSEIMERVDELFVRVQKLEAICDQQNSNIAALQTLLNGIKDNVYITSVSEMDNKEGYILEFSNGKKIAIYHGKDGENGETPSLTIVKEGDNYYWSVNGEILKDEDGNNISASGSEDATPVLKTGAQLELEGVSGKWDKDAIYVSIDNVSWVKVVTGESTQIFTSVEVSEDNQTVYITLSDGSVISMPKTDKILSMLYGKWEKRYDGGGYEILTFKEDMTFEIIYGEGFGESVDFGTYKFVSDRYVALYSQYETWDDVLTIASISETTLYLGGWGTYTRMTEEGNENDENLPSDIKTVILGTWTCNVYDAEGAIYETYSMTFNADGKLSLDYDKPVADTSWSYTEEGELHITVLHIADANMHGTDYTARADNNANPTKFTGDCNLWNYTANGLYTTNSYRTFSLVKSGK